MARICRGCGSLLDEGYAPKVVRQEAVRSAFATRGWHISACSRCINDHVRQLAIAWLNGADEDPSEPFADVIALLAIEGLGHSVALGDRLPAHKAEVVALVTPDAR